jgi:hypothetical protein
MVLPGEQLFWQGWFPALFLDADCRDDSISVLAFEARHMRLISTASPS